MMLKPSDIYFSQESINNMFDKRCRYSYKSVGQTLDDLCEGRTSVEQIPMISVMYKNGKWFSGDNRRLWVFRHLERLGKCTTIPVIVTSYIPSNKFTTYNGGATVDVRRNPGGHWYLKSSANHSARTERRSAFAHLVNSTSGQPAPQTKSNFGTFQRFGTSYRSVCSFASESSTGIKTMPVISTLKSLACKHLPPVQSYSGWIYDRYKASNASSGDTNRLNSEKNETYKTDLPSNDLQMIQLLKTDSTYGSQSDTEGEHSLKSHDTEVEQRKSTHQDDQSSGYCIVKSESLTCPEQMYTDKRNMITQWLMNIDTHDENRSIVQPYDIYYDEDDFENYSIGLEHKQFCQSVVISEVMSACSEEHIRNVQEKTNTDTFMNTKLDVSEGTMSSGYMFFKGGSDNFEGNDDSVQAIADEKDIKNDRSFNAEQCIINKQRNVNSIIKAVNEGLDTRLESVLHASAKEMLSQTRSYFTEVVGGILVAYEKQIHTYQAKIKELRYQMAKLQVETGKTGEGCKAD